MQALRDFALRVASCSPGARCAPPVQLAAKPFEASRARFLDRPLHCDCTSHLRVFEAATYLEPRLLTQDTVRETLVPQAKLQSSS
eukprot:6879671-Alexandrium_andersonii.AAC.1